MAAKRRAGSQLTQDNWDDEDDDEPEVVEVGVIPIADPSVLAKRKIKRATRRIGASDSGASAIQVKASPFGSFKGLTSTNPSTSTVKPLFGVTSKGSFGSGFEISSSKPTLSTAPASSAAKTNSFPTSTLSNDKQASTTNASGFASTALNGGASSSSTSNSEYCSKLRALNVAVSAWIQQHVAKTPVCDLTPVFNDYRNHLQEIERKYGSLGTTSSTFSIVKTDREVKAVPRQEDTAKSNTGLSEANKFSFVPTNQSEVKSKPEEKPQSSLFDSGGSKFTFGGSSSSSSGFGTSGGTVGFSFTGVKTTQQEDKKEAPTSANQEEDETPQEEVKIVEEKDAVFSIRSKLYYKKDGNFKERGVGMLHLKKQEKSGQLILRADTSLGNIIFNISVPKGLPVRRQGKNNVLFMAPLNPPADKVCPQCNKKYPNSQISNVCESECKPEATAILLRVKTGEDADKLKEEIEKLAE